MSQNTHPRVLLVNYLQGSEDKWCQVSTVFILTSRRTDVLGFRKPFRRSLLACDWTLPRRWSSSATSGHDRFRFWALCSTSPAEVRHMTHGVFPTLGTLFSRDFKARVAVMLCGSTPASSSLPVTCDTEELRSESEWYKRLHGEPCGRKFSGTHPRVLLVSREQKWYRAGTVLKLTSRRTQIVTPARGPKSQGPRAEDVLDRVVPRAENFGDLKTADHKVLSERCESRHNHRYAVVVQDLATQWIQSYPCKTKIFPGNGKELARVRGADDESKSHLYWQFPRNWQIFWRIKLELLYVNTAQIGNTWDCWESGAQK